MKEAKVMEGRSVTGFRPLSGTSSKDMGQTVNRQNHSEFYRVMEIPACERGKKMRVCSYCRVSTLMESQETSIEGQRQYYEKLIRSHPEWDFAGIYLELGVTGTKAETRPQLQRLMADCREGKIDLILTKSISRFARNTLDCLNMVRDLTALGIAIRFEKERIQTDSMHSEFVLSILACFAENESKSISGNMKWAIRNRFKDGSYKQAILPYGYKRVEGRVLICREEADLVREIFSMTLQGMGVPRIARELNRRKEKKWNERTIAAMIKNHFYVGDTIYQKSYKDEGYGRRVNRGELDQYYDRDHHEAIISREIFEKAQVVVGQRAGQVGYGDGLQRRSSKRYVFSGILCCKVCESTMYRQSRSGGYTSWQCGKHVKHPDLCSMRPQSEEDLKRAFLNCLNKIAWSQKGDQGILDVYESLLRKCEDRKYGEQGKRLHPSRLLGSLQDFKTFISRWTGSDHPDAFPEADFPDFIQSCTVFSQEMVIFHFRCGLRLTESLCRVELEGCVER